MFVRVRREIVAVAGEKRLMWTMLTNKYNRRHISIGGVPLYIYIYIILCACVTAHNDLFGRRVQLALETK